MSSRLTALFAMAALAVACLGLTACNTVAGAGKDTSALGHDVTRASSSAGNAISSKTGASEQ